MVAGSWLFLGDGSGNATNSSSSGVTDHQPPAGTDITVVAATCGAIGFVLVIVAAWVLYRVAFMDPDDAPAVADDGEGAGDSSMEAVPPPNSRGAVTSALSPSQDTGTSNAPETAVSLDWVDDPDRVFNPCVDRRDLPVDNRKRASSYDRHKHSRSRLESTLVPLMDDTQAPDELSVALLSADQDT